jgi:Serine dehydrogenase proteinase
LKDSTEGTGSTEAAATPSETTADPEAVAEATPEVDAPPAALEVPPQTPYFHAIERDRYQRQAQIKRIQETTGRRLICFVSSPFASIVRDIVPVFADLLDDLDGNEDLDLLLNTPGGDIDAAEKLVIMCRARCKGFRVIVPESAKSAGTMMACSADSILMGFASELGPIDPQVYVPDASGRVISRPAHSFLNGLEDIKRAAKEEGELSEAYFPLLDRLDPALLDYCRHAIERAEEFARKWLERYQCSSDHDRAAEIASALGDVTRFHSHGAAIDAAEAKKIGLQVEELDAKDELWQAIWRLFVEYHLALQQGQANYIFEGQRASIVW